MISAEAWGKAVRALSGPEVTSVLVIQCAVDWLRPERVSLRDEIDHAIMSMALSGRTVRIDRIVLHDIPVTADVPPDDLTKLNEAHADWSYRLSVAADFIPAADRPRVHRLITAGKAHSVEPVDGIEIQSRGRWADPEAASAALRFLRSGATTPLTSYDINRDGPFGDADPSVYL